MNSNLLSDQRYQQKYHEFLRRLKAARLEKGLSQMEVAVYMGTNQSFISRCESGQRRVDVVELAAFANVYQKPMTYFVV